MERKFIKTGIKGLDEILGGGILQGSIITVCGPTGTGKSSLAAQFIYNGAVEYGEPGLYISIEESKGDFLFHMSGYSWDITKAERERKFMILDYPLYEVDQILNQYSAIQELINNTSAKRVVIDSLMPIALHFGNDDERKKGFLKLIDNIRKWGVTTIIVSEDIKEAETGKLPNTEYGMESFTDGWINIFYRYDDKAMERKRFIEILKMKGVLHSHKAYPVEIDKDGLKVLNGKPESVSVAIASVSGNKSKVNEREKIEKVKAALKLRMKKLKGPK
ncbi:hypothetical protein HY988_03190 [Candidatus Micrarchaeota archaeon]|nr:hypothetical protein [Candidatus Micrarchaeota archaeon]